MPPSDKQHQYLTRELDRIHKSLHELDKKVEKGFGDTHKKQDLTNSRVTKLETRVKIIWGILGAVGISLLSVVVTVVENAV